MKSVSPGKGGDSDTFDTARGELSISFIGHGTLMFECNGLTIHVDPVSREADYSQLPDGDLILITHHHQDHLDPEAIEKAAKEDAVIVATKDCINVLPHALVMANGDNRTERDVGITAVPAYNTSPDRTGFHPSGRDNGYVLDFSDLRVYVAGDTEDTDEMRSLSAIDIAFLPMNLPYTMTPAQVAGAAKAFRPKILYPYHFGTTDTSELLDLLSGESEIEVRIRNLE